LLHELDGIVVEVAGAALRSVVEDGHLEIRSIEVTHGDGRVNWIVVVRYVEIILIVHTRFPSHEVPRIVVVEDALLHAERIGVGPEASIVVEAIEEAPVDQHILAAHVFVEVDLVQTHFELDEFFEELGREANVHNCLFFSCPIIKVNGILFKVLSLLINDIWIEIRIRVFVLVSILNFRHKGVSTFTCDCHVLDFWISLIHRYVIIFVILRRLLQMWLVVLEAECERLADLLRFVCVLKQDFSFACEALNYEVSFLADEGSSLLRLAGTGIRIFAGLVFGFYYRVFLGYEILINLKNTHFSRFDRNWRV